MLNGDFCTGYKAHKGATESQAPKLGSNRLSMLRFLAVTGPAPSSIERMERRFEQWGLLFAREGGAWFYFTLCSVIRSSDCTDSAHQPAVGIGLDMLV